MSPLVSTNAVSQRVPSFQADERLRQFVDAAPSGILVVGATGFIELINAEGERLFGYDRDVLLGEPVEILIPSRFHPNHPGYRRDFFAHPEARQMGIGRELAGVRQDGSEFSLEIGLSPIVYEAYTYVLATIVDITQRKLVETALRDSEARFRQVVDAAPSGILVVNKHGIIDLINTEAERLFGYPREHLIGTAVEALIPERLRTEHPGYREGFFDKPESRQMGIGRDLAGVRADGTEFPLEIGLSPIEVDGEPQVLATIVDITQRKNVERALADRSLELERSNAELETFAYVASHDLRAPLRGIDNLTQVLEEDLDGVLTGESRECMQLLRARVGRLEALLDDILEYSRVGRTTSASEWIDTQSIIRDICELLVIPQKFTVSIVSELPQFETTKARLEQVFRNLISNSIKHSDNDSRYIEISHVERGAYYIFTVSDDGPGIPYQLQTRIFEMFQTLRPRDEVEGSGMGLAIVKKLVELNGGELWVESDEEKRATSFHFEWPKQWQSVDS